METEVQGAIDSYSGNWPVIVSIETLIMLVVMSSEFFEADMYHVKRGHLTSHPRLATDCLPPCCRAHTSSSLVTTLITYILPHPAPVCHIVG